MDQNLKNEFLEALQEYKEPLVRLCSIYASDVEETQDLFQDALVSMYISLSTFQGKSNIKTWMYRITLNVCLRLQTDKLRSKVRFVELTDLEKLADQPSIEDHEASRLKKLRSCIKRLNDSDRAIVTFYLEELPYREIGEIVGVSENLVAVKLKRIRKKLFHCITDKK